ncbi:MAG TPA: putative baseplate assembly protein [Verrucomicrobiae bacterium]|nr:putative baseplate assembly protein [Verrucomicrobiae bacterium]
MTDDATPVLDGRLEQDVLNELLSRCRSYVPELIPAEDQPGYALCQIVARDSQTIIQRLNQAPDKNLLAFLDLMGVNLIPSKPARAAVVFETRPGSIDGHIEAGLRLGAQPSGSSSPVLFETENAIALAAAKLVQVVSLWPDRDTVIDHTQDLDGGRAFTIFQQGNPIEHVFYLGHETAFAFKGGAIIQIEFELFTPGSVPLSIIWEFWDGQTWRPFHPFDSLAVSIDGTAGLTRSGVVTLKAECGDSHQTIVDGIESYWVRARLDQPLPPNAAQLFAVVDRIRLRAVIDRPLQQATDKDNNTQCVGPVRPDTAFAGSSKLDLTTTFYPLGKAPDSNSIFYLSCDEIFSKLGAVVDLGFTRGVTPAEEGDNKAQDYQTDLNAATNAGLTVVDDLARDIIDAAYLLKDIAISSPQDLETKIQDLNNQKNAFPSTRDITQLATAADALTQAISEIIAGITITPQTFANITVSTVDETKVNGAIDSVAANAKDAAARADDALRKLNQIKLNPTVLLSVENKQNPPALADPVLVWEYWNGDAWSDLSATVDKAFPPASPATVNLQNPQQECDVLRFVVPQDWQISTLNGTQARWMRARITSGSFNRLRFVSWFDAQSNTVNIFPILEPRPPVLHDMFLGYRYHSVWMLPEQCLTTNDFMFEWHSLDASAPGTFFPLFHPVADALPALYFGLDRPLPNDLVTILFDLDEQDVDAPPLVWEYWNGSAWQTLSVTDETQNLTVPGVVSFLPPALPTRPTGAMIKAGANQVTMKDAATAAVFVAGDQIVIQQGYATELAIITRVQDALLDLQTPLSATYSAGTVTLASLPRFGSSCDWVRARLKEDALPLQIRINGLYLNAAWAQQLRTVPREILGSGNGQLNQSFFFSQAPVLPGEQIQVRELDGARAEVELPMLQDELQKAGLSLDLIRTVSDPRTNLVTEVWVQWQSQPNLFFSGPDDRHYVVDRARGRVLFGDGRNGRLPTIGSNNVRAALYQTTIGFAGNVPAGSITQLLSGVTVAQTVNNPRAAEGGADGEQITEVSRRGPQVMRHEGRALSAADCEALALEASPGVAIAKALTATAPNLRPAPGFITIIIVPGSVDALPQPSHELRQEVHDFLASRVAATVSATHVAIIGPVYLHVGVRATIIPLVPGDAGDVKNQVIDVLQMFLHPISGGPEGNGWAFGRGVFQSDIAEALLQVAGIDYIQDLQLLRDDVVTGDRVSVPPERIVAAGTLQIEMQIAH